MNNLFKNNKKLFILILVIPSIISLLFIIRQVTNNGSKTITTTPKNLTQATYNSITPGVSTKEEVIQEFGKPIKTELDSLEFKSLSPNRNNQVDIVDNKVSLVKEIVTLKDTRRTSDIVNNYGLAQKILYGEDAGAGFYLFIYPENGIAYVGHPESGRLLEIWYFPPTNLSDFKTKYAKGYSENYQLAPDRFD